MTPQKREYSVRDTSSVHTAGIMFKSNKKKNCSFFWKVFSQWKEKQLWIEYCMLMEAAITNVGCLVRRAGPCTLKGFTVFYFVHSAHTLCTPFEQQQQQRPAAYFMSFCPNQRRHLSDSPIQIEALWAAAICFMLFDICASSWEFMTESVSTSAA